MYNAVGGSTIIFAGAWPRALPSDFRVRSLDGIADDWPIDYFELLPYFYRTDRDFGVSGLPGDPAYPPDTEDAPMPPLPIGSAGMKVARGMTKLGWHWWPEFNSINSVAYDGRRPCVQRSTCQSGCNEGAKASTDLTHWPKAIALGARLVTGARVRRIETNDKGLATGATWIDGDGNEHFEPAKVVVVAANAIGTPRLLLLSRQPPPPGRPRQLVGPRRQAADDAPVRERRRAVRGAADELAGPVRRPDREPRVLRDRREARLRPRRPLGPRARPAARSTPRSRAAPASRPGARTTTLHVKTHLGHGANWGLFAEDLPGRGEPHHDLVDSVTDSSGIPAPEVHYPMADNSRRMLDFHIERAKESMDAAGAYKIEVDRLMRYSGWHLLGTARMGDDPKTSVLDRWNRTHDVPEPVRRRRLVLRDVVRRQPDVDDRRDRAPGRRPHGRDAVRAAGAGMTVEGAATLTDEERANARRGRRPADPGRPRHAVGGRVVNDERLRFVLTARPDLVEPLRAALAAGPGRRRRALGSTCSPATSPPSLGALQLVIVAGYYTDKRVRELIGYPGQMAIERPVVGAARSTSKKA